MLSRSLGKSLLKFEVLLLEVLNTFEELLLDICDLAGKSGHLIPEFLQRSDCLFGCLELVGY